MIVADCATVDVADVADVADGKICLSFTTALLLLLLLDVSLLKR